VKTIDDNWWWVVSCCCGWSERQGTKQAAGIAGRCHQAVGSENSEHVLHLEYVEK